MPVTRRLMKPGTFSLRLQPDTPYKIHSAVTRFDQIVITPTRLYPIEGYSNANILAAATYSGVVTKTPSPTEITGHGLEWYLGSPKGYGAGTSGTQGLLTTAATQSAATLSTWVTALCPPSLAVGTVTNGALPTLSDSFQFVTRREALDAVCRQIGAEYRVNPDGTIDAAAAATLFGSSADVVVTRKPEGRDGGYWGLEGNTIVTATDVDDYISKAIVVTRGEGTAATATTTTGTAGFRDFAGNAMHVERYIDAPTALAANAGLIGTAAINKFNAERRDLRLTSRTYNVTRFINPGEYVFVYHPVAGLTDQANQVIFRGEVMTPLLLRVYGLTWPLEKGMGVYARRPTGVGTYTYTDLSDWVVWENGEVQWEVGTPRRPLIGTNPAQSEGTVAYLGQNPEVTARATARDATAFTPSWTNLTVGDGTTIGRYTIDQDGWCDFSIELTFGSTTAATGDIRVALPAGLTPARKFAATATYEDAGTRYYAGSAVNLTAAGVLSLLHTESGNSGIVNATNPFTWTITDDIWITGRFPIA